MRKQMIRVRIFATLRQLVGQSEVEVPLQSGATVREVLAQLAEQHPALGERLFDGEGNLQSSINLLINGRNISFLDGLDTTVHESDRLALFPAVGGG
jgi:molybdopterin synthase sulfur carrier subunit